MSPFRGFSEHILNPKLLGKRLHLSQTVSRNIHLQRQNLNLVVLNKFIFFHPTFFECEFSRLTIPVPFYAGIAWKG